jgi:hypothetical protein
VPYHIFRQVLHKPGATLQAEARPLVLTHVVTAYTHPDCPAGPACPACPCNPMLDKVPDGTFAPPSNIPPSPIPNSHSQEWLPFTPHSVNTSLVPHWSEFSSPFSFPFPLLTLFHSLFPHTSTLAPLPTVAHHVSRNPSLVPRLDDVALLSTGICTDILIPPRLPSHRIQAPMSGPSFMRHHYNPTILSWHLPTTAILPQLVGNRTV